MNKKIHNQSSAFILYSQSYLVTMALALCIALIIFVIVLLAIYFRNKFQYFKLRKIDGPSPGLFGNTKETFFKRKHLTDEVGQIYKYDCVGSLNHLKFEL